MSAQRDESQNWATEGIKQAIKVSTAPALFCTGGELPAVDPGLEVEGVGRVSLPLKPATARALVAAGRPAPFGKGTRTLTDAQVRKSIEFDASQVQLSDEWNAMVAQLVVGLGERLGLKDQQFDAEHYKLLLYEVGGRFLPHRDSEKADRMVASLVVVLPTKFVGGELVVRHERQVERFRFDYARNNMTPSFAAFYANCEHEVERVTSGRRLCLTYNLKLRKQKRQKRILSLKPSSEVERLSQSINDYTTQVRTEPLVFAFAHHYTEKGLSLDLLKGGDRDLAELVVAAADASDCRVHLCQVERHLSQSADDGSWGRRVHWHDDRVNLKKLDIGDTFEDDLFGHDWHDLTGKRVSLSHVAFADSSVVSQIPIGEWKPDKQEYEGYTGNAGNTLDRWYHRSAIVVWREVDHFNIVAKNDFPSALKICLSMHGKLAKAAAAKRVAVEQEFWRLVGALVHEWPTRYDRYWESRGKDEVGYDKLLKIVASTDDRTLIENLLAAMVERDHVSRLGLFVTTIGRRFGVEAWKPQLERLLRGQQSRHVVDLTYRELSWLHRLATNKQVGGPKPAVQSLCQIATTRFVECYATEPNMRYKPKTLARYLQLLVESLIATECHDELASLIVSLRQKPSTYRVAAEQTTCLVATAKWCDNRGMPLPGPIEDWVHDIREQLSVATRERPCEPTDWKRPAALKCKCRHCQQINEFLIDAEQSTTLVAAAEYVRAHVNELIRIGKADLTSELIKKGSPYQLKLSKTRGSFERAVKQFAADEAALALLDGLPVSR